MIQSRAKPFLLCFRSLFESGRGYVFPCDENGRVDLDHLSEGARNNYFYARAMVGRELAAPDVEACDLHSARSSLPDATRHVSHRPISG